MLLRMSAGMDVSGGGADACHILSPAFCFAQLMFWLQEVAADSRPILISRGREAGM
jgi:hypothetical protein